MSAPDTTVTTTTTVDTSEEHDGILPEPDRTFSNVLWLVRQLVLGLGILWMLGVLGLMVWTPDNPKGSADAATVVAVVSLLVTAFMQGYQRRQN